MKTASFLSFGFTLALLFTGCDRSTEVRPTTTAQSFEEQLTYMLTILDDHHDLIIKYETVDPTGIIRPVFYFVPKENDPSSLREAVGAGAGTELASSCKNWLDAHPTLSLKINGASGSYSAVDGGRS
ncbi:MAG: hypothetical protein IPN44_01950 [Flavobacteriales bacterium]|nr:hypothetical protein [Flavobacteriales bacterium]